MKPPDEIWFVLQDGVACTCYGVSWRISNKIGQDLKFLILFFAHEITFCGVCKYKGFVVLAMGCIEKQRKQFLRYLGFRIRVDG